MDLNMVYLVRRFPSAVLCALTLLSSSGGKACTGWGYIDDTPLGEVLFVKNRDKIPSPQSVELRKPDSGYRSIGLYAKNPRGTLDIKAGINEKHLTVGTFSVGSLPKRVRPKCPGDHVATARILRSFASVAETLAHGDELFSHSPPIFFMLADRDQVSYVEVAPKPRLSCNPQGPTRNEYAVFSISRGSVAHANHYVSQELRQFNVVNYLSSITRLNRINELLATPDANTALNYLRFTRETVSGPNNSLFRFNTEPGAVRTVATWMVRIPRDGAAPTLRVSIYLNISVDRETGQLREVHEATSEVRLTPAQFERFSWELQSVNPGSTLKTGIRPIVDIDAFTAR